MIVSKYVLIAWVASNHSFNTSKTLKKTNISYHLIRKCTCSYQGVRNASFSENFAYVPNKWSLAKFTPQYYMVAHVSSHVYLKEISKRVYQNRYLFVSSIISFRVYRLHFEFSIWNVLIFFIRIFFADNFCNEIFSTWNEAALWGVSFSRCCEKSLKLYGKASLMKSFVTKVVQAAVFIH